MAKRFLRNIQEKKVNTSLTTAKFGLSGLSKSVASLAQQRIWFDEKIYSDASKSPACYNVLIPCKVNHGSMSIDGIQSALTRVLEQHHVLRTAIYFNEETGQLEQELQSAVTKDSFSFQVTRGMKQPNEVDSIIFNECTSHFAQLDRGLVLRCHLIKISDEESDYLYRGDVVLFIIHHIAFDLSSIALFVDAFTKAYDMAEVKTMPLHYIDYTLYEYAQLTDQSTDSPMNSARQYWTRLMHNYDANRHYPLPYAFDINTKARSGLGHCVTLSLDAYLANAQMEFVASQNISMFQLGLACYFTFLYQLSKRHNNDTCVLVPTYNRSLTEVRSIIGMFANLLPYRVKIDPLESFVNFVQRLKLLSIDIMEHSLLPYQNIMGYSKNSMFQIPFSFDYKSQMSSMTFGMAYKSKTKKAELCSYSDHNWEHGRGTAINDLSLTMIHNHQAKKIQYVFECSADLYDEATLSMMSRRYHHLLEQLFTLNRATDLLNKQLEPITKLSLVLPEEAEELQRTNFDRLPNIIDIAPASYAQERIWCDLKKTQLSLHNILLSYRMPAGFKLSLAQLRQALELVIMKHESLRTSLVLDITKNMLIQKIMNLGNNNIEIFRYIESFVKTEAELKDIIYDELTHPDNLDLEHGLVFRCHVIRWGKENVDDYLHKGDAICFIFHPAVVDYSSMKVFFHDLDEAYKTSELLYDKDLTLRYIDYSVMERKMPMTVANTFWLEGFRDHQIDLLVSLPYDRQRVYNESKSGRSKSISFHFKDELSQEFFNLCSTYDVKPEHLTLAYLYSFLFKLTNGQKNICTAIEVDNHYKKNLCPIVGNFLNTIIFQYSIDPYRSFNQLLENIKTKSDACYEHSYFPLQRMFSISKLSTESFVPNASILFKSTSHEDIDDFIMLSDVQLTNDSNLNDVILTQVVSSYDFSLSVQHDAKNGKFLCAITGSLDLFESSTLDKISQRFHLHLSQMLTSTLKMHNTSVHEISLMLPSEKTLIKSINTLSTSLSSNSCIQKLFMRQSCRTPQKIAVELDNQSLTHAELLYNVQYVAAELLEKHGIMSGDIVCQCVDRSVSMVVGIMSIIMIGGVYCPLTPGDPQQRLYELIERTKCRLVLAHSLTRKHFTNHLGVVDIESLLIMNGIARDRCFTQLSNTDVSDESIAYVIFTSGSTGIPKGVKIRHKNFMGMLKALLHAEVCIEGDVAMQMAGCSYDVHVQEIIGSLIIGASLVILHPHGILDIGYVCRVFLEKQVTYLQTVPKYLNGLLNFVSEGGDCKLSTLRSLDIGGEYLPSSVANKLTQIGHEKSKIWNIYGPAETTVDCTLHLVSLSHDEQEIPIGRSLLNYQCLILDEYLQPVLTNHGGELFIGGIGVFAGYLYREDLTAKALVYVNAERYYRTGDLVRINGDGLLVYIGRKDFQVKLRGQRIELEEIEHCLIKYSTAITGCIVMKCGDEHLVAYVEGSHSNANELRDYCRSHLASFMVPSIVIVLKQFPLNVNGKVDRKSLPQPDWDILRSCNDNVDLSLLSPLEEHLCKVVAEVLNVKSPNINTLFEDMGATSLDLIRMLAIIRRQLCPKVDVGLLFQNTSIRKLASVIQPLLNSKEKVDMSQKASVIEEVIAPKPWLSLEAIGVILLVILWFGPIYLCWIFESYRGLFFIPLIHLLSYVIFQRLSFFFLPLEQKPHLVFSLHYYQWWFLERLWSINCCFWLKYLVGTPFYNYYLRICGARIGNHTHIYTIRIDAPWLLEVGESAFIANETLLSNLYLGIQTFEIHSIRIGSYCSISTRCVLYGTVNIEDHVYISPMSAVTGHVLSPLALENVQNRSFTWSQSAFQVISLVGLFCIHVVLFLLANMIYRFCCFVLLPMPLCLSFSWLIWMLTGLAVSLILLKFIVAHTIPGNYPINSYYFLRKLWLRQLIVSSFDYSFKFLPHYESIFVSMLRWLGAHINEDVRFADYIPILLFPSNLLRVERGVTTFGRVIFAPYEMTMTNICSVDEIFLKSGTTLGNACTIMPGSTTATNTMIGVLSLVTRETNSTICGTVLLGIPASKTPFMVSNESSSTNTLSSEELGYANILLRSSLIFLIVKCLVITLYSSLPILASPCFHWALVCIVNRYLTTDMRANTRFSFSIVVDRIRAWIDMIPADFFILFGSFVSRTQYLVFISRTFGVHIGQNVILPDIQCLTDQHLVTIGDNVRFHTEASAQCHTFEQRIFKLDSVIINHSSVLMDYSFMLPGSLLQGKNRLLPLTLILKKDQLPENTSWAGVPARQCS